MNQFAPLHHRILSPAGTFVAFVAGPEDGKVVLCLHGFPDTPVGYFGLMERLVAAGYRVVAPYMRGYAPSTLAGPYDVDRLGDDVIAFADAVAPAPGQRVHLIGHDWGAVAAYVALARSPGRFDRAVTMAVPHPHALVANLRAHPRQLRNSWYMGFFQLGALADKRVARGDFELIERLWAHWSPGFRPSAAYIAELKRCLGESMPAPLEYYRSLFRPLRAAYRRFGQRLEIRTPTLALHGANDGCIDTRVTAGQARFFAAPFEAHVLPRAGHFLHIEQPEETARLVLDWFARRAS